MVKRFLFLLATLSIVLLAACGEDAATPGPSPSPVVPPPDGGGGLSGIVNAPAGGDVAGVSVVACLLVNNACDPSSQTFTVTQPGLSGAFNFSSVGAGQYIVYALKDADGNGSFSDPSDYIGSYTLDGQNPAQVTPPAAGLSIQLRTVGGGVTPPSDPGGAGDVSGTVSVPTGGDVAQTVVVACFLEGGQCNGRSPNTQGVAISTAGPSGNFTVPGLAAGQYIVGALKDVNGNGSFEDPEDYYGCYGGETCTPVTPPQAGLSIQMAANGGAAPDPGTGGSGSISGTLIFPGSRDETSFGALSATAERQADSSRGAAAAGVSQAVLEQVAQFGVLDVPDVSADRFVPGEVVVKFRSEVQLQSLSVQGLSLQRTQSLGLPKTALYRVAGLDERGTLALIRDLTARPDVLYAEPNYVKTVQKVPNDAFYPFQWHYEAMNLPAAWDIEDGEGGSVTVAVVDSGSLAHPDLLDTFVGGYDFVSDPLGGADGDGYDPDPTDLGQASGYHGAHVAGTIAAGTNNAGGVAGVSWGAKVLPLRALGVTGTGSNVDIMNAVLWAAGEPIADVPTNPNPAQVINLSLGGEAPCSQLEQDAFNTVRAKGVTIIVAAGNENTDVGFSSPANCDGVIAVGATGPQNTRAPYSNYGTGIDVMAPGGDVDQTLTVEGQTVPAGVLSTVKDDSSGEFDYVFYQGTSMAAPHIAGLVALMLAQEPGLDPDTVLARLQASATPLSAEACGQPTGENCGAGLVDAAAALSGSDTPVNPTPPAPPQTGTATTYVAALYCVAQCSSFDADLSGLVEVSADTLQAPYEIRDLVPGTYIAAAWQDLNGDEDINDGEPFGRHFNNLTLASGQALDRADIYLEPVAPQGAAAATANASLSGVYGLMPELLEQRPNAQSAGATELGELETAGTATLRRLTLESATQLLQERR